VPEGGAIMLGVRPEAFGISPEAGRGIRVELSEVQHLGNEQLAFFRWAGADCVARLAARPALARGETLHLTIDLNRVHVFDANGQNLTSPM
jgi:ABC-type sugar transport system ATPase subunit